MSQPIVNRLIADLPSADRSRLLDRCESVDLVFGDLLCEPDQPYRHIYFPLSGFLSLVESIADHHPLEIGSIGNEGMLGATVVLGIDDAPLRALVQGSGTALRMTLAQLRRELRASTALTRTLHSYLYVVFAQLSQTAGCTRFHVIEARLARCLLLTHDRAHADHFHLTHQYLADMLGVLRSAVTHAAGALQQRRLIRYTRGAIRILDRRGLEAAACECYDAVIDDYRRLFT